MLTENNPNLRMVLERNPNFHGEPYPAEGSPRTAKPVCSKTPVVRCRFVDRAVYSLEKEAFLAGTSSCRATTTTPVSARTAFDQAVQFDGGGEATD
jgi:oligopeptide transport system substrate-binding protein